MSQRTTDEAMQEYFRGERLYGDDMTSEEILDWYRDEEQGYFKMEAADPRAYEYRYFALNEFHGFRHVRRAPADHVLSFGGAYGNELKPVAGRAKRIVIVDPGAYTAETLEGTPIEYRKPSPSGALPAADGEFDLVTCFGALHHVPNVSTVLREMGRVLKRGGHVLIREPIVSMGDWRVCRHRLTKRERGIPLHLLRNMVNAAGISIICEQRCIWPVTPRLGRILGRAEFNSPFLTRFDAMLSRMTLWRTTYHPTTWWRKMQPSAAFIVGRRGEH